MLWILLIVSLLGNVRPSTAKKSPSTTQESPSTTQESPSTTQGKVCPNTTQGIQCCNSDETISIAQLTTSQSSTYEKLNSQLAIDGQMKKCAHTLDKPLSWWTIDLLGTYNISALWIYTTHHHNENLTDAEIYIGNSREKNGTTNALCHTIEKFQNDSWNEFKCTNKTSGRDIKTSGRYITVVLKPKRHLSLCEVQICGRKGASPFKLVKQKKTWEDALSHCRDHKSDLASITDDNEQGWAELEAINANTAFVWLGLRYSCILDMWFWVDDQPLGVQYWNATGGENCDMSAALKRQGKRQWFKKYDNETYNFICTNDYKR